MKIFRNLKVLIGAAVLTLAFTGCEEDVDSPISNFVGFEIGQSPKSIEVTKDATESFDVNVYATETASSDRTFNILSSVPEGSTFAYSVPSQVTIPGGSTEGVLTLNVTDNDDLGFEAQQLVLAIEGFSGNELQLEVVEACTNTIATFNLILDTWPDETSWEIYDLTGTPTVLYSGGPYVNPDDDFAEFAWDYCLAPGDYGVVVYDSYGDGGPSFSVTSAAGDLVPLTALGGSQASATFTIN
jgi:hypothetical protein